MYYYRLTVADKYFMPDEDIEYTAELDNKNENIIFRVQFPVGYWVGIGFGTSMTNTSILLIDDNLEREFPYVNDTFSTGHRAPTLNTENLYRLTKFTKTDDTWELYIQRPIVIEREGRNETIPLDEQINMYYAFKNGEFSKHAKTDRGFFLMKLHSATHTVTFGEDAGSNDMFYKVHGIIMYMTWSILTFIALVSGRYMRHLYNFRMILHASVGTLIMSNTIIIVVLALTQYKSEGGTTVAHKPIGILVLVVSILQFMGGITVRQTNAILKWKSKYALFSKLGHQVFGLLIILVSNFQVVTGLVNYESPVKNLIYLHFAVYLIILVFMEILYRYRYKYKGKGLVNKQNVPEYSQLQLNKMIREGRKLVLFNDYIVDVESFLDEHPGTRFVLTENLGREVGKYFYGAYAVEHDMPSHTHSSYAASIIEKLTIGKLKTVKNKPITESTLKSNGKQCYISIFTESKG